MFLFRSKAVLEHYTSQLKNDLQRENYNIQVANVHPGPVVTEFEQSAKEGERFKNKENPYQLMEKDIQTWRELMQEGRPVEESVKTIVNVINSENPDFWNATEPRVAKNFAATYVDPTGNQFSKGPIFTELKVSSCIGHTLHGQSGKTTEKTQLAELDNVKVSIS